MCTAITYQTKHSYFGRNLDLEYSYQEQVAVTPRNFPFHFRKTEPLHNHYAMIGMAFVQGEYPLYYDAVNEHGLGMAGLNFPGNAVYYPAHEDKTNITPFELIPWIVGQCKTVAEAKVLLGHTNIYHEHFSEQLPLSPLHWMISDKTHSIVVETIKEGMRIYDNPYGVMTNNPTFDFMEQYLRTFRHLSPCEGPSTFAPDTELPKYCVGLPALGLPGDHSSASRFVRAAFTKLNSVCAETEGASVSQFFHLLGAVEMPRGAVRLQEGVYDITVYSSCCNQDTGVYYYTTYDNRRINGVDMHKEDLEGDTVISYPLRTEPEIGMQN